MADAFRKLAMAAALGTLLVAGLCLGCANAWHWVTKEQNTIQRGQGNDE